MIEFYDEWNKIKDKLKDSKDENGQTEGLQLKTLDRSDPNAEQVILPTAYPRGEEATT